MALLDTSFRRTAVAETLLGWLFVVVWVAVGWWAPALLTAVVLTLWRAAADARDLDRDDLTGVLSRGAFALRAATAAERARRGVEGAAYLFIDLDGFKALNDGPRNHVVGDQVLIAVGERLRRCVRVTDAVGRLGGDEFAILFGGVNDEATAEQLAARVHAALVAPYLTEDGERLIGASIGVALALPGRRDFEPDLRQHADAAMYQAKATGGGVRIWAEVEPQPT
jgi:diguanylate cyclase (GGDEF)-like protein